MHKLIPNIERKIEKTLLDLKLKPEVSVQEFIKRTKRAKHRYSSLCRNNKGQKLIFYARLHQNKDAKTKMAREISFFKKSKNLKISKYIPEVYSSKKEKGFEWLSREYFKTPILGLNERLDRKIENKQAKILARAVFEIKSTELGTLKGILFREFPVENYLESTNQLPCLIKKGVISQTQAKKIKRFFEENKYLLEKENKYFCHGDLNLGNIIISKGAVKIIDWESAQINNPAFDMAYLFCHLWQAPRIIRKTLISSYLALLSKKQKTVFLKLFPVVVFYLSIHGIEAKPKEIRIDLLKKRKEFFQKLLKKSHLGVGEIIRI